MQLTIFIDHFNYSSLMNACFFCCDAAKKQASYVSYNSFPFFAVIHCKIRLKLNISLVQLYQVRSANELDCQIDITYLEAYLRDQFDAGKRITVHSSKHYYRHESSQSTMASQVESTFSGIFCSTISSRFDRSCIYANDNAVKTLD